MDFTLAEAESVDSAKKAVAEMLNVSPHLEMGQSKLKVKCMECIFAPTLP